MFNFYQINEDSKIRARDYFVMKALISYQKINSTKKLKLLYEVLRYNLYYSLKHKFLYIVIQDSMKALN
jgi:hypothetical protein